MDVETVAEEWRAIPGFELYEVSNLGRVRSWNNKGRRRAAPRELAYRLDGKGYARVCVGNGVDAERRERFVHQLVLEVFVAPRPDGFEGRHLNGVRCDNRASNLEWSSHAENMRDQYKHGTRARGRTHGMVKLTVEDVRVLRASNERGCDAAKRLGISETTVCKIRKRQLWKHVI